MNGVSFAVNAGETVALIGRSGSGKSTLLNLISGLEPIQTGDVKLNQQALGAMTDRQRTRLRGTQIGFVYQAFNLIPTLSVADNISLPLALANVRAAEQKARLDDMLHVIGLGGRGNDYPDQLSGGEQQRVAIARALIHRPALILADEPTGNLDAVSGRLVLELLKELVDSHDSALLLVTHSGEVAAVSDRVLLLDQGDLKTLETHELSHSAAW
nr:ABC transporter ATP-binding protein [Granulosicoccus sp.]